MKKEDLEKLEAVVALLMDKGPSVVGAQAALVVQRAIAQIQTVEDRHNRAIDDLMVAGRITQDYGDQVLRLTHSLDALRQEREMVHALLAGMVGTRVDTLEAQAQLVREELARVTAQRDNLLDASAEGAWMARALDAERERDAARQERDALRAKLDEREHAAAMACETPDPKCDCSGCSLARDEDSRLSPPSAPAQDAPKPLCQACWERPAWGSKSGLRCAWCAEYGVPLREKPAQDAPIDRAQEVCAECRGIGWDAESRSDCGACNGTGKAGR